MLYLARLVDAMQGRTFRGLSACAALCVTLSASRQLHAQEQGPTLLSYAAPHGCPGVAEFQRSVQRRSTRVRFVDRGVHDRELSIAIRNEGESTHGELRLVEGNGRVSQRSVRFTGCAEAVEGLALIAVVSLDPQALLEPEKPREAAAAPVAPVAPVLPAGKAQATPKRDSALESHPPKTSVAFGGVFNVAPSVLPATALGGSLFLDVAAGFGSWYAPLFRLATSHVERRGLSASDGAEANFTLTLMTASACPVRLSSGFLELRPCAFMSGGALYAWGSKTTNLQRRTRPYGALGGSVLLLARASQAIDIVADLAVGASLLRDSFGFDRDQPWQTPRIYLSSGIGARFVFR
jgi:hypothetical protein